MVKLFNIQKDKETISCNYTPEDSNLEGFVEMNLKTKEPTNITYSKFSVGEDMYVAHVCSKLRELITSNKSLPDTVTVVWY